MGRKTASIFSFQLPLCRPKKITRLWGFYIIQRALITVCVLGIWDDCEL